MKVKIGAEYIWYTYFLSSFLWPDFRKAKPSLEILLSHWHLSIFSSIIIYDW